MEVREKRNAFLYLANNNNVQIQHDIANGIHKRHRTESLWLF